MSVYRIKKTDNFSIIPNAGLRDTRLSAKAKGLWALMLSYPNDWEFSTEFLIKSGTDGRDSIRAGLKELEDNGYMTKETIRDNGKFVGYDYTIYEVPKTDLPKTENPKTENPTQRITNNNTSIYKTKNCNNEYTPYNPPSDFDKFWSAYPKKKDKANALKAFKKVQVPIETILAALEKQKKSADWIKNNGQYIPYPTTWLNGKRWEDEADPGFLHGHVHVDGSDPNSYIGERDDKEKLNAW